MNSKMAHSVVCPNFFLGFFLPSYRLQLGARKMRCDVWILGVAQLHIFLSHQIEIFDL